MPTRGSCSSSDSPRTPGTVWAVSKACSWVSWWLLPMPASEAQDDSGSSHMPQEFVQVLFCCLRVQRGKDAPMLLLLLSLHPPLKQWCLASLVGLGVFQVHPKMSHSNLFNLTQPTPVLSLGLTSKAQASASSPCPHQWTSARVGSWGAQGGGPDHLYRSFSTLPTTNQLLCSPSRLQSSPSPGWSLCPWGDFLGVEPFLLYSSLLGGTGPVLISFPPFLPFFSFFPPITWRFPCPFRNLSSSASIQCIFYVKCFI